MRVLALDQSTSVTGYAVIEDGQYIQSGTIDMRRNHDAGSRLKNMMLLIGQLINSKRVDKVVFEDVQQQTNSATYKLLSQLQGAIIYYCYTNDLGFTILTSSAWRKILKFEQGKRVLRRRLKEQSIEYVKEHCGKEVSDDEADAICIGFAAIEDNRI